MKRAVLAVVFVSIVVFGALVVLTKTGTTPAPSPLPAESTVKDAAVTIIYTDSGFSSSKINVNVGDVVAVKNQSSNSMQFSSNPHPIHTGNKELNQQTIPAGGSLTFTVTVKGSHGFHNHLTPSHNGILVVE